MSLTRVRRGREVEIPEEWVGQVTHPQTIRKRPSKLTRKLRNATKNAGLDMSKRGRIEKLAPTVEEWL